MAEMSKACIVVRLDGKVSYSRIGQGKAFYPKTFTHFLVNSHGTKTLLSEIPSSPVFLTHRFLSCPDCPVRFTIIKYLKSSDLFNLFFYNGMDQWRYHILGLPQ